MGVNVLTFIVIIFAGIACLTLGSENKVIQWQQNAPDTRTVNIDEFLIGVLENFKNDMVTGLPELKIPILDPFQTHKPIHVHTEDAKVTFDGNFTNLQVEGLSGFVIEDLKANLLNLSLSFHMRIPRLLARGNYSIDGKIIKIIPIYGDGGFWVDSYNLSIGAKASIFTENEEHLQLYHDFDVDMDFDKVQMDFENFLGGGRWTEVVKKVLNDMSKDLLKKCLPLLKGELNKALLTVINQQLKKVPLKNIKPSSTANEYIDQILVNVRNYITEHNLDPMDLPEYVSNFSKKLVYVDVHGEAKLYDGKLSGISTLYRADDCGFHSTRKTITISAHLGLNDLELYYRGEAKFMSLGSPRLQFGFHIKEVIFYVELEQSNEKGASPHIVNLVVTKMSTIYAKHSGLGPLSWAMKWIVTGVMKFLQRFIVGRFTEILMYFLDAQLENFSFPI